MLSALSEDKMKINSEQI